MTEPQPIATAPKDGRRIAVGDEAGNIAAAFWHQPAGRENGMWCYPMPEGETLIHQVDFEPTHWAESATAFLPSEGLTPPTT